MNYDFEIDIRIEGTGSYKWVRLENLDAKILPFDAADMEFRTSPEIIARLEELARLVNGVIPCPRKNTKRPLLTG